MSANEQGTAALLASDPAAESASVARVPLDLLRDLYFTSGGYTRRVDGSYCDPQKARALIWPFIEAAENAPVER